MRSGTCRWRSPRNEILCVVGESGSGKSMMANAIMRLLPNDVTIDGGRMMFEGRDLCAASVAEMREVRGAGIAMIFQEPMTALNPLRTIGDQIAEMFSIHTDLSKAEIGAKVLALLADVRIPDPERGGKGLSARAVRRPAPARHDRDGAGARSEAADRRRADHRARRHHAGADPETDPRPAAAPQDRGAVHHPRFRRRRRDRRPRRGDAARRHRRTGHGDRRAEHVRSMPTPSS